MRLHEEAPNKCHGEGVRRGRAGGAGEDPDHHIAIFFRVRCGSTYTICTAVACVHLARPPWPAIRVVRGHEPCAV